MTKELKEIAKLKKLCEEEIIEWLSALTQLERLEHWAKIDSKIKKAFKAKK